MSQRDIPDWFDDIKYNDFDRFIHAVTTENIDLMKSLIVDGFDVNTKNEMGETPFSYACANNVLKAAKFLYEQGADINTVDQGGGSPLDWAVCWSSYEFRDWLRGIGAKRVDTHEEVPWPRED